MVLASPRGNCKGRLTNARAKICNVYEIAVVCLTADARSTGIPSEHARVMVRDEYETDERIAVDSK